jgi:hypothetical protein
MYTHICRHIHIYKNMTVIEGLSEEERRGKEKDRV